MFFFVKDLNCMYLIRINVNFGENVFINYVGE